MRRVDWARSAVANVPTQIPASHPSGIYVRVRCCKSVRVSRKMYIRPSKMAVVIDTKTKSFRKNISSFMALRRWGQSCTIAQLNLFPVTTPAANERERSRRGPCTILFLDTLRPRAGRSRPPAAHFASREAGKRPASGSSSRKRSSRLLACTFACYARLRHDLVPVPVLPGGPRGRFRRSAEHDPPRPRRLLRCQH